MASVVAYYRPRGIQGNYKLGILLDLLPTEQAKVFRQEDYQPKKQQISPSSIAEMLNQVKPGQITQGTHNEPVSFADYDLPEPVQQNPVRTIARTSFLKKGQGKITFYVVSQFTRHSTGQQIIVEIYDADVAEHQTNIYTAAQTNIEGGLMKHRIELNRITLIDLDAPDNTTLQQYKLEIQQLRQTMQESSN